MLSYRHGFHAGNHGDLIKHAVVALLCEALKRKDTPFAYVETHAGAGRYDLRSEQARKTGEYLEGIAKVWQRIHEAPRALSPYLDAVRALNPSGELDFYPGSPRVARHLLRLQDRMVLMELHTNEYPVLKQEFAGDAQVAVHHRDGYEGLNALLPPREKRGVVVLDPSYEVKTEFLQVAEAVVAAYRRFSAGIYAIWYPLLSGGPEDELKQHLARSGVRKILQAELWVRQPGIGMYGSGMLVINPPWQLDTTLAEVLPWLAESVGGASGHANVRWLVPE